jgi:hypothetical protein
MNSSMKVDTGPTSSLQVDDIESDEKPKHDIIDLAINQGIQIKLNKGIKDSEYIVNMCTNDGNAYLSYKKKNFLKNKEKDQIDIIQRLSRILSHR